MKIRSVALFEYLVRVNALNGTPEALAVAKREYRRQYKRNWKQQKRPVKEIRFFVTMREFTAVDAKAKREALRPATFAKSVLLSSTGQAGIRSEALLNVLQAISMAVVAMAEHRPARYVQTLIVQAERLLLAYLNRQ